MKVSRTSAPFGLMICGAAALIGTAAPARAEGRAPSRYVLVQGLVTAATDDSATAPGTLTVHSPYADVGDVVLTVNAKTRFHGPGDEPDAPGEGGADSAVEQAVKPLSPASCVGLFARAVCDNNHVALNVAVSQPEAVFVSGVVDSSWSPGADHLVLDVQGHGTFDLVLNAQTMFRLDGLPSTEDNLAAGDSANVLFWPTASGNEALRVDARTPPPLQFEGVVSTLITDDGGAPVGFSATQGSNPATHFMESSSTVFTRDGNPATANDLKVGDNVHVSYRVGSDGNDALEVAEFTPQPNPVPPVPQPFSKHHDAGSGSTSGGDPGSNNPTKSNGGDPDSDSNPKPNGETGGGQPAFFHPRVVGGVVGSVDGSGNSFSVTRGSKSLTFAVDAKTTFQINDKPATFADLKPDQHVYVLFRETDTGSVALRVLIVQTVAHNEHGKPGGAHP